MLRKLHFANGKQISHSSNDEVSLNQLFQKKGPEVVLPKVSAFTFFLNKQFICSLHNGHFMIFFIINVNLYSNADLSMCNII